MRQKVTAFLLSALVFPGLGQLYNQDRKKGIFLVLTANLLLSLLLLGGLVLMSREYYAVFFPAPLTFQIFRLLLLDTISHPVFLFLLFLMAGLWGFAAVDAVRHASLPRKEEP